jgi:hypothetical protein
VIVETPALSAFSAINLPTALAVSILVPVVTPLSLDEAETIVTPLTSSMICA